MSNEPNEPIVGTPKPSSDRGFLAYAGGPIPTEYGHTIRVQESSAASGPHVWLFIGYSPRVDTCDPHLNLDQALALRAALDQFIEGVPDRWEDGQSMLDDAKRRVLPAKEG